MSPDSPALPVWIVPDAELTRNGGTIPVLGQPAIPLLNPPDSTLISSDANNQLEAGSDGKLFVPASGASYLSYVAEMRQLSTNEPFENQGFVNTLGGDITWSRTGTGSYQFVLPNSLTNAFFLTQMNNLVALITVTKLFGSTFNLSVHDFTGSNVDGARWWMEIRVY